MTNETTTPTPGRANILHRAMMHRYDELVATIPTTVSVKQFTAWCREALTIAGLNKRDRSRAVPSWRPVVAPLPVQRGKG